MDNLRVYVRGGVGGTGFQKYGGIGGRGGHIYVEGNKRATLRRIVADNEEKRYIAKPGGNSKYVKCSKAIKIHARNYLRIINLCFV